MPRTIEGEALIRLPSMNKRIFPPRRMTLCKKGSSVYLLEYRSSYVGQIVDFTRFEARESADVLLEELPKRIKLENGGELEEISDLSAPIQRVRACIRILKNSIVEVKTEIEEDIEPTVTGFESRAVAVRDNTGEINKRKLLMDRSDEEELFDNEKKDTVACPALTSRSVVESRYRRMREVRAAPRCRNRRGRRRKVSKRGVRRDFKLAKSYDDSHYSSVQTNEETYTFTSSGRVIHAPKRYPN
ncbi:unnamed protein product [Cylicocyclus nassatus]|uniref:Uncharacterized protein n=1 Tax=Cylicocyclus nassatus TaxID=53992 RepID=A0AA36HDW1_CYLNA|nr:unnamed protein product [Cylicocyclus nassatus]